MEMSSTLPRRRKLPRQVDRSEVVCSSSIAEVRSESANELGGIEAPNGNRGPRIAVLLATYNSEAWLRQQLDSIFAQRGVVLHLFVSDDRSTDNTVSIIHEYAHRFPVTVLPCLADRFGNASRNFLRLIRDTDVAGFDHVAFSDHDDIWNRDKLRRAVDCIVRLGVHAYSSDVTAFWADGREELVLKSKPQRMYDYLFESPGPGCTFVFLRASFEGLRSFMLQRFERARQVKVHDWLIYAYARTHGWSWYIDNRPSMRYRQHGRNEIGANVGWRAIRRRFWSVCSGEFRNDVLTIADLVGHKSWVTEALRRLRVIDRLRLMLMAREFRRRRGQCWTLAVFFLIMPKS